jgi:hypothetical protein
MSRSTIRSPDDIVPSRIAVSEKEDPGVVLDVGSSAPTGVSSENFHIPSAAEGVLNFLLDVDAVVVEV